MHVGEQLAGVMLHHPQDMQQSFVSFRVDCQFLCAKSSQGPADEMRQGQADGNLAIVLFRGRFDDRQENRVGGGLSPSVLPRNRTYGSVYGGS
ncbi:MAG: hypothetical protein WBM78_28260 [Desulfobacterales bacterium]